MVSSFPDVSSRLDHVIKTCGYPSAAEFARAIGEKNPQNLVSWRERDSFGKGDVRIAEKTGADLMWLKTGRGEPFPNGPIRYAGAVNAATAEVLAKIAQNQQDIKDLGQLMVMMLARLSETTPAAGQAVAEDLRAYLARPGVPSSVLPEVMNRLEAALRLPSVVAPRKKPRTQK